MITSRKYHLTTCYDRTTLKGGSLDWANKPEVFKGYPDAEKIDLAEPRPIGEKSLWDIHSGIIAAPQAADLSILSSILDLTCALTAKTRHPDGTFYYRSVASAGALYPIEMYAGVYDVAGIDPGLYYFDLKNRQLATIHRKFSKNPLPDADIPKTDIIASFFITGVFFRSSWKYRQRAYRYVLLDAGHLLHNLFLSLTALGISHSCRIAFPDDTLNKILGLNENFEACLCCVHIHPDTGSLAEPAKNDLKIYSLFSEPGIYASYETPSPPALIQDIHRAGKIEPGFSETASVATPDIGIQPESWVEAPPFTKRPDEILYPKAVLFRRSRRNFIKRPMDFDALFRLLELFKTGNNSSFLSPNHGAFPVIPAVTVRMTKLL